MKKKTFWIIYFIVISMAFYIIKHGFSEREASVWTLKQNETYGFTIQVQNHLGDAISGVSFHLYEYRESTAPLRYLKQEYVSSDKKVTAFLEATTRKNGILHFYGLKEGIYFLEEIDVPSGYQLLKERITVRVDKDSSKEGIDYYIVNGKVKR